MKHMKHMIGCVAMIAVVAVIFLVRGGDTPSWFPIVLVLGCPLMMIAMMAFMMRGADPRDVVAQDDAQPANHA